MPQTVPKTNPEISTVSRNGGQKLGTTSGDRRKVSDKELHTLTLRQKHLNNFFGHFADYKQRVNVDDVRD